LRTLIGAWVLFTGGAFVDRRGKVEARLNNHKYRIDAGDLRVTVAADQFRIINGNDEP
jgi:hypothetical protein